LQAPAVFFYLTGKRGKADAPALFEPIHTLKGGDAVMVFNFLFFTVKIERNVSSAEARLARYRQDQLLKAREEAHVMEAAQYPEFVNRI
jgi:hypothetical protein